MIYESLESTVARVQKHLDALRGGQAKIWHFRFSYSQLVVRIKMPGWTSHRVYMDCVACSSMSFVPAWEPVNLAITIRADSPNTPLLVADGDHFRVECQSVRVEEMDDDNGRSPFPPTSGLGASSDLVDRIREGGKGIILTESNFSSLDNFLRGYQKALSDHRIAWNDDLLSLIEFQKWVKVRLGCERLSLNWVGAIKTKYEDDDEAYCRFFELWEEYRTQKHLQMRTTPDERQSSHSEDQTAADGERGETS